MQWPEIEFELKTIDKSLELLGWLSIIAIWGLTISSYTSLPETIPTHYNSAGQADGFGGKATIFTLPSIAAILFVGLTVLTRFPHVFNYPADITPANALRKYTNATRLIRYLKLITTLIFGLIVLMTLRNADGQPNGPGIWFLPLIIGMITVPVTYFVLKSFKTK